MGTLMHARAAPRRVRLLAFLTVAALLAGCAGTTAPPATTPTPTLASTPAASPAAASTPMPASPTSAQPRLGVVFEETFDYEGNQAEVRRNFTVDRGVDKLTFFVDAAGPPEDRSFTSAVMDVYAPRSTGAMFAELPGQEKRNYTLEHTAFDPYWGTWMVRFGGTGKTSVTLRVTAE